jgi:hypothetical protein
MIKHTISNFKWLFLLPVIVLLTACAGGSTAVPITIQSNPLGGHVTYQLPSSAKGSSTDWIYMGKTPIDLKQNVNKSQLKKAQAFRVKVFKDGYNDQIRDWSENEIDAAVKEKGHIFWNPKLVPNGS